MISVSSVTNSLKTKKEYKRPVSNPLCHFHRPTAGTYRTDGRGSDEERLFHTCGTYPCCHDSTCPYATQHRRYAQSHCRHPYRTDSGLYLLCADAPEVINTVASIMKTGQRYHFLRDFIFTHPSMNEGLNMLFKPF